MGNNVRLNKAELRKLARGPEVMKALSDIGDQIVAAAGAENYEVQEWVGRNRDRVTVRTKDDFAARAREARDHNLIRALGSVRGG